MTRAEAKKAASDEKVWREEVLLRLDSLTWQGKQQEKVLGEICKVFMGRLGESPSFGRCLRESTSLGNVDD